jgi:hypothetical protein
MTVLPNYSRRPSPAGRLSRKGTAVPFRRITWRAWAFTLACVCAYIGLGFWLAGNGTVETWMYRTGLTAAAAVPLAYVGVYTAFGLASDRPAAKWWRTALGSSLVIAALSLVPVAGPLAWVFWMDGGMLTQSWLAWIEVSGPCVSALAWLRVCQLWLRVHAADAARRRTAD